MLFTTHGTVARRASLGLAALALGAGLAGCQSASTSSTSATEGATASADPFVATAQAAVEEAQAQVTAGVPESSPPALTGKSVVLIPCAQAGEGCAQPAEGAAEAAQALGWTVTTIDGKGSADAQNAAIQQAITLKADAIITFAIDPSTVRGALEQARAAGITVIASSSPKTDLVDFSDNPPEATWKKMGALGADYIVAKTNGSAKVALLTDTEFAAVTTRTDAFAAELSGCSGCELVSTTNFTYADSATSLPATAQQLVQSNPGLSAIYVPYDAAVPAVLQGLKAVGAQDVLVVSGDGTSQTLTCLREQCGQSATVAFALDWIGWSDIDALNRLLQGQDPTAAATVPVKLITTENVGDSTGAWDGDVDFRSAYKKLWNVG